MVIAQLRVIPVAAAEGGGERRKRDGEGKAGGRGEVSKKILNWIDEISMAKWDIPV